MERVCDRVEVELVVELLEVEIKFEARGVVSLSVCNEDRVWDDRAARVCLLAVDRVGLRTGRVCATVSAGTLL